MLKLLFPKYDLKLNMPITLDRGGVPLYSGDPKDWKEYQEGFLTISTDAATRTRRTP